MKSFRSEEPLSTTSKNKGFIFEIGNQNTTRKQQQKIPFQLNSLNTEECDNDTHRSQQAFKQLKNLEFQNELFMLEMQHGQRRKEVESNRLKFQLSSIKSDIDFMKSQLQSPVSKVKPKRKRSQSIDSEQSSDRSSSSSSDNSYVKCPIKFKHYEPTQKQKEQIKQDSYATIENRFKQLFQISDVNDKLNWMVRQYFNSFHSIQLDLQNNLLPLLLDNTLKLLIEIIDKLNSIKLDSLQYKSYDPFQNVEKNNKRYSSDLDIEAINQEYQFQGNHSLVDYCQKVNEQSQKNNQFSTPQYKQQQQTDQKQSAKQLSNMMKQKPDSSCQTSNNQTLDKRVSISERNEKKTSQKTQLMPSLKNRQK